MMVFMSAYSYAQDDNSSMSYLPEITIKNIDGKDVNLADYGAN